MKTEKDQIETLRKYEHAEHNKEFKKPEKAGNLNESWDKLEDSDN